MQVIPAGVSGSSVMMLGSAVNNYPQVQKQKLWEVNHLRQSVYLDHRYTWQQQHTTLGRYNVSSASCGYDSYDRMTHDAVVALHKNVQIVVMQKCRVMKKLLSVNTFHSLWVATTQFFFISPKLEQHPPTLNQQMSNNLNWNGQLGSRILQLKCCW